MNEGNFGWGNPSLGVIGEQATYTDGVFESKNGRKLGDIFQSVYHYEDSYYLVVNNSGKIEVINDSNFFSTKTISGFNSPRYLAIKEDRAFVSELFDSYISTFPLNDPQARTNIEIGGGSDKIFSQGNEMAIHSNGNLVFVNTGSLSLVDSFSYLQIKSLQDISENELALIARREPIDTSQPDIYLYIFNMVIWLNRHISTAVVCDL